MCIRDRFTSYKKNINTACRCSFQSLCIFSNSLVETAPTLYYSLTHFPEKFFEVRLRLLQVHVASPHLPQNLSRSAGGLATCCPRMSYFLTKLVPIVCALFVQICARNFNVCARLPLPPQGGEFIDGRISKWSDWLEIGVIRLCFDCASQRYQIWGPTFTPSYFGFKTW